MQRTAHSIRFWKRPEVSSQYLGESQDIGLPNWEEGQLGKLTPNY
jgi:hypothetical protein